jgi:hypothetical protein
MKIFILEDSPERVELFMRELPKIFPKAEFFYADSADAAISIFERHDNFFMVLLDHDLGGKQYVNSWEENTGYRVAVYIFEHRVGYDVCITHSMNPAGAQNILAVLPRCIHKPMPVLLSYLKGFKVV